MTACAYLVDSIHKDRRRKTGRQRTESRGQKTENGWMDGREFSS